MTVKLISATPNAEELITYCARVSNPQNQELNPDSEKLIKYLIKHKHWSPFEMAHVVMEINTTRAIAAQILRHRSFSFQEFSQRYATAIPNPKPPDLRRQDHTNRQNSFDDLPQEEVQKLQTRAQILFNESKKLYDEMLSKGVARECARDVLPLCTPTRLYMAGSVRSWIHYIDLRMSNGTQKEHRQIAMDCHKVLAWELPNVCNVLWQI